MPKEAIRTSPETRNKILHIAESTDSLAITKMEKWRMNAICGARWLLYIASQPDRPQTTFIHFMDEVIGRIKKQAHTTYVESNIARGSSSTSSSKSAAE